LRKHPPQNEQRCFLRTNGLNREFGFKVMIVLKRCACDVFRPAGWSLSTPFPADGRLRTAGAVDYAREVDPAQTAAANGLAAVVMR
jgi:hypothetical protein